MSNIDKVLNNLKDIKANVEIPDNSLYYFLILIGAILIFLLIIFIIWYKRYKKRLRRLKKSPRYKSLEILKNLDYSNTKNAVYTFSKYTQILVKDEQKEKLKSILKSLEKYKFKKDIKDLDSKDIKNMKSFIKELKV